MTTAGLKVGNVIEAADADYMYGTGRLRIRVTKVGHVVRIKGAEWVDLEGFDVRRDGLQIGGPGARRRGAAHGLATPAGRPEGDAVTIPHWVGTTDDRPSQPRQPNHLLRRARLARRSPSGSGRRMSRQELAEAVTAHVFTTTKRVVNLSSNYIGKLERGEHRWPCADYRAAFSAVLGVARDADLGFYIRRRTTDNPVDSVQALAPALVPRQPVAARTADEMQLVVAPGMAVIVVAVEHPVFLALMPAR